MNLQANERKYSDRLLEIILIFESIEISSDHAYFYHLIFACIETAKGSQWMDAIRKIRPKIEGSNAGTVKDIINIIKGNQSQLTDF